MANRHIDRGARIEPDPIANDHPSGIRVHTYGPHYFRTSSARVWEFATRYARFYEYEPCVVSDVGGELAPWPVSAAYIRRTAGRDPFDVPFRALMKLDLPSYAPGDCPSCRDGATPAEKPGSRPEAGVERG